MQKIRITKELLYGLTILVFLYVFMHIAHEVIIEKEVKFDTDAAYWIASKRTANLTRFFSLITWLGSSYFLLPGYVTVVMFQIFYDRYKALIIAAWGIVSSITLFGIKYFYHRIRPTDSIMGPVKGFSFPSGHSMSTFIFFGILCLLVFKTGWNKYLRLSVICMLALLCLFVGLSRVYLAAHFASDVIAGYCLGLIYIVILYKVLLNHDSERKIKTARN